MSERAPRYAVILTHNRPELLRRCVAAIGPQVDMIYVIDNASEPAVPQVQLDPTDDDHLGLGVAGRGRIAVLRANEQPPNLSKMWAAGIDLAILHANAWVGDMLGGPVSPRVAVLCDDAIAPEGWFDLVDAAMTETGASVGASNPSRLQQRLLFIDQPDRHPGNPARRMPGHAWILDTASPVRPDPQFRYWWGDTDVDWQARRAGGLVLTGTHAVENAQQDYWIRQREDVAALAREDGARFGEKWAEYGGCPW